MAQYEEESGEVISRIEASDLNAGTKASIRDAIGGKEKATIADYEKGSTTDAEIVVVGKGQSLEDDPGSGVIIMDQDSAGANVTIDTSGGGRVLVAGGGDDQIIVEGEGPVTVETGGGSDSITAGGGDDFIVINGDGNNSVDAGQGDDTIALDTSGGASSIEGGEGFDTIDVSADSRSEHRFISSEDGLTLHSAETKLSGVELVQFSDSLTVIADNADKADAARLYEVIFGREADIGGMKFWMEQVDAGKSIQEIANFFVASDEFQAMYSDSLSNEEFVARLYENSFNRSAEESGLAFWTGQLEEGKMSRGDVALFFADSQEAVTLMGIDGTQYVIDVSSTE